MKLRIKGNSVRLRLTKSDVKNLSREGTIAEETHFGDSIFRYKLVRRSQAHLSATYEQHEMIVYIPDSFANDWDENDVIGLEYNLPLKNGSSLFILVEKDFVCLDETTEDQSDNYENPNQNC